MKVSDLEPGATYTNGKGGLRRLVRLRTYDKSNDEAVYEHLAGVRAASYYYLPYGPDQGLYVTESKNFARWAKTKVEEAPDAP